MKALGFCVTMVVVASALLAQPLSATAQVMTYRIKNVTSGHYLVPSDLGNRDDKRNVLVWPAVANERSFQWVLQSVPSDGESVRIVNVKTGLALTQDGTGDNRNVSNWGTYESGNPVNRQLWLLHRDAKGTVLIVNKETQQGLTQAYQGHKSDQRNVTTWPGQKPEADGWTWALEEAGTVNLNKLTLISVRCIHPSKGQDANSRILFGAIDVAIAAAAGGATAYRGTHQASKIFAQNLTRQQVKDIAKNKALTSAAASGIGAAVVIFEGSQDIFNRVYGESPDDLDIRVSSVSNMQYSIWPGGGRNHRKTKSQQIHRMNMPYIFEGNQLSIHLWDYDSGSKDDSLGRAAWNGQYGAYLWNKDEKSNTAVLVDNQKTEGSLYEVEYKVERLTQSMRLMQTLRAEPFRYFVVN